MTNPPNDTTGHESGVQDRGRTSPSREKRFIVAAAVRQGDMVCSVKRPGRHHHVMREMAAAGIPIPITGQQGFLTSDGLFVNRFEAQDLARAAGQIIRKIGPAGELFSEDVW